MYQGYLAIGGRDGVGTTEIINALRTHAYASHLVPSLNLLLPPSYEAPDLPELLGHPEYGTPISDQPVWVDGDVPASYEFLGLYPKEIVGLDESTWHADTEEYVQDGGVPLRGRNEGREILVKGLMVATTDAGMDAGMAWLRNVLSDTECREAGECGGERMIVMASPPKVCPEAMGEEVDPNAVHPCLVPYVRQYYRVQAIEGVKVLRRMETDCGPLVEVEFMLYAGVPQPHRLPEFIGMAQSDPVATYENLITNPSFENGLDTVTASPSAILTHDDTWSSAGDYSLRMQATREPDRVRRNYVLNPSLEDGTTGWAKGAAPLATDYAWTGTPHDSHSTRTDDEGTLTNVVTNPRGRNTSGTVTLRENLILNPSFEYGLAGWSSTPEATLTIESASPIAGAQSMRWERNGDTASSYAQMDVTDGLPEVGQMLYLRFRVLPEFTGPMRALFGAQGSGQYGVFDFDVEAGVEQTLTAEWQTTAAMAPDLRCWIGQGGGMGTTGDAAVIDQVQVSYGQPPGDYGDGDTTHSDPDLTWQWTGTPGESTSQLTAPALAGWTGAPGLAYYSAKHDAIALTNGQDNTSRLYRSLSGTSAGEQFTWTVEMLTEDEGMEAYLTIGGAAAGGGASSQPIPLTSGEWTTEHLGIVSAGGSFVWRVQSDTPGTIYVRAAVIDGTDTYAGPWWDGDTPDTGEADWSDERTDEDAFSGAYSLKSTVSVGGAGVSHLVDLADLASPQRSAAFYVKVVASDPDITGVDASLDFLDAGGNEVGHRRASFPLSPSGWTRVALATSQSAVTATQMQVSLRPQRAATQEALMFAPGDVVFIDAALAEGSTLAGTYFDGDTPDDPGITYAWEPDGGSSATYEGVISSTITYADLTDGSPLPYDINPGSTYHLQAVLRMTSASAQNRPLDARTIQVVWTTLSGSELAVRSSPAPNLPGEHEVSLDFDVPDNVTHGVIRLYGGTSADTWWDSVLLSEQTPPHYFDGSSVDEDGWVYAWEGSAHASASLAEYNPAPPETIPEVTCDAPEQTIVLRRNLYPNPGPTVPDGWQSVDARGSFSARFVPDNSLRAGGQSLEVERLRGNRSIYMAYIDRLGYRQFASSRPRATAGQRYTASVWVKTDRVGKAQMRVGAFDASNTGIAQWHSAVRNLPANTWTRLRVTFTAPQGTANIASGASTYVNSSTMAPTGALSWFAHALLERTSSLNDYFDGNFSDTPEFDYAWEGVPGYSESIITDEETGDLLVDPDCPYIPPPPTPPEIPTACIETPDEWTRFTVLVASEYVPRWGSAMPVVSLYSGSAAARQIRIRFYPVADPDDPQIYNECSYDIEFILTYLPPNSEMIIDGVTRSADVSVGGGQQMSALHLLTGSGGEPYTWGSLTCDRTYLMTVDVAPLSPDASVSLSLVGRE